MKILAQFVLSLIGAILLGIVGLIVGAYIGGNFGFPAFGGNVGYESGGVFFAIVGISFGSLLGTMLTKKLQKDSRKYLVPFITCIASICYGVFIFDYSMPAIVETSILLLPPAIMTLITNWEKIDRRAQ